MEIFMSQYNYFANINVDGYSFPTSPQVSFGFNSQAFSLLNRGFFVIQYSFDGHTIHGDLNSEDASKGLVFDGRCESKIFLKAVDGYGICRVEAWY